MKVLKLVTKNAGRHRLRTVLTVLGMAIAIMAFCVIRSAIGAWYSSAKAASPDRLVARHAVSIVFDLPLSYRDKIQKIEGVKAVSYANWFGGQYVDPKNFFPKFAIDKDGYLTMYPEILLPRDQYETFLRERNAVIVGRKLADRFGWEVGDPIRIVGDIYPGDWDFVIRGIYTGAKETTDESTWFFRFDFLDERMRVEMPGRDGRVGWFVVQIDDPSRAAEISAQVDALFANSIAETKTETEEAFTLSFIEMSGTIIFGLRIVSFLVIGIILLVLANTMAMTARERLNEHAVLKTLGFRPAHLVGIILGESLFIAALGGLLGLGFTLLTIPVLRNALANFLPVIPLEALTLVLAMIAALVVGVLAAVFPTVKALHTSIVDGLRIID